MLVLSTLHALSTGNGNMISESDKQLILKYHNIARAQVGSSPLSWSSSLESAGVQCLLEKRPSVMQHGICKGISGLESVGENLASGGDGPNAALMFIGEKCAMSSSELSNNIQRYSFSSASGHWTQVVWKTSSSMSCVQTVSGGVIYCHYASAGNMIGASAYDRVPTKSDCSGNSLNRPVFTSGSAPSTPAPAPAPVAKPSTPTPKPKNENPAPTPQAQKESPAPKSPAPSTPEQQKESPAPETPTTEQPAPIVNDTTTGNSTTIDVEAIKNSEHFKNFEKHFSSWYQKAWSWAKGCFGQ